jgi:hypothetical protein
MRAVDKFEYRHGYSGLGISSGRVFRHPHEALGSD